MPLTPDDMQNRIDRLEGLVLTLMQNGDPAAAAAAAAAGADRTMSMSSNSQEFTPSSTGGGEEVLDGAPEEVESETDGVTNSLGVLHVQGGNKSMYLGNTHWAAVLDDVSCWVTRSGTVLMSQ